MDELECSDNDVRSSVGEEIVAAPPSDSIDNGFGTAVVLLFPALLSPSINPPPTVVSSELELETIATPPPPNVLST